MPSVPDRAWAGTRSLVVILTAVPALALGAVGIAAASPSDVTPEKRRLVAADNAHAERGLVARAWLPAGWRKTSSRPTPDEKLVCSELNADLSRFTITGNAAATFTGPSNAEIDTEVEVFKNRAQASEDLRTQLRPAFLQCLRSATLAELRKESNPGVTITVTLRTVSAARVGDRSGAFRIVIAVKQGGVAAFSVTLDVVLFQKGRALGYLGVSSMRGPAPVKLVPLARRMAARL